LLRVHRRLRVVLEVLQRAHARELGDRHAHLDAPLVLARYLGRAQHRQRLAQVQLGPPGLVQQGVELVAYGGELQSREHRLEVVQQLDRLGLLDGGHHQPPPSAVSYSASGRSSSAGAVGAGATALFGRASQLTPTRCAPTIPTR
jgi:hypothetical protein